MAGPKTTYTIEDRGYDTPCWVWQGAPSGSGGYPAVKINRRQQRAHRWMYERHVGPIPAGLTLDHLCRVRMCVNPAHLEPVTMRENLLRGTGFPARQARQSHCKNGHPLSGDNLYTWRGQRHCRECVRRRCRELYRRKKETHA